eukprot:scpid33064/ scgid8048/ Probable serine/threonine-protein kinase DDB_G0267514
MDTVDSCVTDCPICFLCYDVSRPPLATPCGHSFCRECASRLAGAAPHRNAFTCPLCRELCQPGAQGLRVNAALRALVEELAAAHQRRERRRNSDAAAVQLNARNGVDVTSPAGVAGGGGAGATTPTRASPSRREFQYRCPRITYEELELEALIDSGAFGEVHRCRWQGQTVATKVLRCGGEMSPAAVDSFQREVEVMSILHHPNIVLMLGACVEPPRLCLVLELMTGGSLYGLLHCACARLEAVEVRSVSLDMAHGLQYLHSLNILHRDLKSKNVLLTRSLPRQAKLCDFGLSRVRIESATMTGNIGTPQWTAPEVLNDSKYRLSADIYSFGIVLLEIVTNKLPFAGKNPMAIIMAVGVKKQRPPIPDSAPALLKDLIERCTRWEPAERPSMLEVVRILETYTAPEPDKASVLYQTLAYCDQQSQPAERNWSVESAIRSKPTGSEPIDLNGSLQFKGTDDNQDPVATADGAAEQAKPSDRAGVRPTTTTAHAGKAMHESTGSPRSVMAATSFFSPLASTEEELRPLHLDSISPLLRDSPVINIVGSKQLRQRSMEGSGSSEGAYTGSDSTIQGSPQVSSGEAHAEAMGTGAIAGAGAVAGAGAIAGAAAMASSTAGMPLSDNQSPEERTQIESDFELALRLQREEDEAMGRPSTTEYDSMLAQELLQRERQEASLDAIPPHVLSSLDDTSAELDPALVREQYLAYERISALSPNPPYDQPAAVGLPPPRPPPLPQRPRRGRGRLESFGDEAARHMAMQYALEDVETFPSNQLRATRTAEHLWKPTAADLTHDRHYGLTPTNDGPAARFSPMSSVVGSPSRGVNATAATGAAHTPTTPTTPVYPPPNTSPGITRSSSRPVVPVLPPPSSAGAGLPPRPPPLPPPLPALRPVDTRPITERIHRANVSHLARARKSNPRRAFSAVVGEIPKFEPCRLQRSHTVQYSGLPTRSEYVLEKQQMDVIARQREVVEGMHKEKVEDAAKGAGTGKESAQQQPQQQQLDSPALDLMNPRHTIQHLRHIKNFQDNLRKVREFKSEWLHHVPPEKERSVLSSGITISTIALTMFADMKIRNSKKYIGLHVSNQDGCRKINVAFHQNGVGVTTAQQDERWFATMVGKLPHDQPRFVLFDLLYSRTRDQRSNDVHIACKLILVFWCPDSASVGQKMIYASSKGALRQQLGGGVTKEYRAQCHADLEYAKVSACIR